MKRYSTFMFQPRLDVFVLMHRKVVSNNMQLFVRIFSIQFFKEGKKVVGVVRLHRLGRHFTGMHCQRCNQGNRAVPLIGCCLTSRATRL